MVGDPLGIPQLVLESALDHPVLHRVGREGAAVTPREPLRWHDECMGDDGMGDTSALVGTSDLEAYADVIYRANLAAGLHLAVLD